jgi:hypothetical protein
MRIAIFAALAAQAGGPPLLTDDRPVIRLHPQ